MFLISKSRGELDLGVCMISCSISSCLFLPFSLSQVPFRALSYFSFYLKGGRVGFDSNERVYSVAFSLQSTSSNSYLWKQNNCSAVIQA